MLTTSCRWRLFVAVPSLALACVVAVQAAPAPQAQPSSSAVEQRSPSWAALTPGQRAALAPLQADWDTLDPARQGKWLEIARRWPALSADEQQRLQRRMGRWARMTAEERSRARLQFQQTRRLDAEQRRAAWEAYQALSPEARRELAQQGQPASGARRAANSARAAPVLKPVGPALVQAAPGVSTVSINRLPAPSRRAHDAQPHASTLAASVDRTTLLPRSDAQAGEAAHAATAQ